MWEGIFLPGSPFSAKSLMVFMQSPCAITCVNICMHIKNPKHWHPHHVLHAWKYCHAWVGMGSTVLVTAVRQPKFPSRDNEIVKKHTKKHNDNLKKKRGGGGGGKAHSSVANFKTVMYEIKIKVFFIILQIDLKCNVVICSVFIGNRLQNQNFKCIVLWPQDKMHYTIKPVLSIYDNY